MGIQNSALIYQNIRIFYLVELFLEYFLNLHQCLDMSPENGVSLAELSLYVLNPLTQERVNLDSERDRGIDTLVSIILVPQCELFPVKLVHVAGVGNH